MSETRFCDIFIGDYFHWKGKTYQKIYDSYNGEHCVDKSGYCENITAETPVERVIELKF